MPDREPYNRPPHENEYLRRRARRSQAPDPASREIQARSRSERYTRLNARRDQSASPPREPDAGQYQQLPPRPARAVAAALPNTPLAHDLLRARTAQSRTLGTPSKWKRLTRRKWFWPALGVPSILAMVALLILTPVLFSSFRAYRDVQVGDIQHNESSLVAQLNREGTPELVERTPDQGISHWNGEDRITILLLGADLSSSDGSSRTDTIMLVNIDPRTKSASILSIPRDVKVVIPGYGIDKINAAFALGDYNKVQGGGAGLMIRTIEANFGIPIHGFVQIDFNGFIKMIDTVGGIYVDVPYPILDNTYPAENFNYQRIYFPAGWQHLDGEEALIYARTRHQDGDASRAARQQQVLLALRDQHLNPEIITQLPKLITDFGDTVRTDISITDAIKLAQVGLEIPRDRITQIPVMPALYEDIGDNGIYYLGVDWLLMEDLLSDFVGYSVSAPGAAYMDPDYSARILVINGTSNRGLAGRVGTVLEYNGFWQISVDTAEDVGNYDRSTILDVEGNLGTSALVSELISVGQDTITFGDQAQDAATDSGYRGYDIVVILGNDAWDPAGDAWTLEDYTREQQDEEPQPVGTPAPIEGGD
jgi:polyisoprenyl-teichoic acid--peptidoglycan teichoic acid transferase